MHTQEPPQIWGVIPAAGIGQRMQSAIPKQYLQIDGKTILQHSCERLLAFEKVTGLIIVVREDDTYWPAVHDAIRDITDKPVETVGGGVERADSVGNALHYLLSHAQAGSWVMVHDAVRPCVPLDDIRRLHDTVIGTQQGGLLAVPVRDTMKRTDAAQYVQATENRENLWHALTPQCFQLDILQQALATANQRSLPVTDESSAMEIAGYAPKLVMGSDKNIKLTRPEDLQLAKLYLEESS